MHAILKTWGLGTGVCGVIALSWDYYTRRKAKQWRVDLCDNELQPYGPISPEVNAFTKMTTDNNTIQPGKNPGLLVNDGFLNPDEVTMLARFSRELVRDLGLPMPHEGKVAFSRFLHRAGFPARASPNSGYDEANCPPPASGTDVAMTEIDEAELIKKYSAYLDGVRYVSDHAEDAHSPGRAMWGCGDALRLGKMPLALRAMNHKVKEKLPHLGHLRHVYLESSPTGEFMRTPKPLRGFDGHEYVIIPFCGDDGAVLTFTPAKRDYELDSRRVMQRGWTAADIDVFVPCGAMLNVRSRARFKYNWGMRPGQPWFGHPRNELPLSPDDLSSLHPRPNSEIVQFDGRPDPSSRRAAAAAQAAEQDMAASDGSGGWLSWIPFVESSSSSSSSSPSVKDGSLFVAQDQAMRPYFSPKWWGAPRGLSQKDKFLAEKKSRGVLVLAYEGPLSEKKQRKRMMLKELDCYGIPPAMELCSWAPDKPPSPEDLEKVGLLRWMLTNYTEMLKASTL